MINRLHFTAACLRQAWFEGLAEATTKATSLAGSLVASRKGRVVTTGVIGGALGLRASGASAATGNCAANSSGATSNIVKLFQNIGVLLYVIGGVFSLVCFAGAALMFMSSGNNSARADKAMKWAKNTVIGLVFLAGGFFFRSVIVDFVGNSGSVIGGNGANSPSAANGNLQGCDIPATPSGG